MASKGLIAVLGLAGLGAFVYAKRAQAGVIPDEQIEFPEDPELPVEPSPEPEPGQEPAEGPDVPSGSGDPEKLSLLPPELLNINLSGNENYHYVGTFPYGAVQARYLHWTVDDSLNGMPIKIFVLEGFPNEWISFFWKTDPPGSKPPAHAIVYRVSPHVDAATQAWMFKNILGLGT